MARQEYYFCVNRPLAPPGQSLLGAVHKHQFSVKKIDPMFIFSKTAIIGIKIASFVMQFCRQKYFSIILTILTFICT
jgi:hypothetical protein